MQDLKQLAEANTGLVQSLSNAANAVAVHAGMLQTHIDDGRRTSGRTADTVGTSIRTFNRIRKEINANAKVFEQAISSGYAQFRSNESDMWYETADGFKFERRDDDLGFQEVK